MKYTFSILCFLLLTLKVKAQFPYSHQDLLDSMDVLASADGVVCSYGSWKDSSLNRYAAITGFVYNLTYKDSRNLMASPSNIKKAHGFINALRRYADDITLDMDIFKSTDSIKVYNNKGTNKTTLTLGRFCSILYNDKIKTDSLINVLPKVLKAIKAFVNENAMYPNSFKIVNEDEGGFTESNDDTILFTGHYLKYSIKAKNGIDTTLQDYFFINDKQELFFGARSQSRKVLESIKLKQYWLRRFGKGQRDF